MYTLYNVHSLIRIKIVHGIQVYVFVMFSLIALFIIESGVLKSQTKIVESFY